MTHRTCRACRVQGEPTGHRSNGHRRVADGLTLIEVMVAIVIVLLVFTAIAAAMTRTSAAKTMATGNASAEQVANSTIAKALTGGWSTLGFYGNDTGYAATGGPYAEPTVTLATTAPSPRPSVVPMPTSTVVSGGITYHVATSITWVKNPALGATPPAAPTAPTSGYKRISVTVTYTLNNITHTVSAQQIKAQSGPSATPGNPACDSAFAVPFCTIDINQGYVTTPVQATLVFTNAVTGVGLSYSGGAATCTGAATTWTCTFPTADTFTTGSPITFLASATYQSATAAVFTTAEMW